MEHLLAVIVVTGCSLAVVGGLAIFFSRAKGLKNLCAGQSDRETAFLATEMAASYDAARHVREEA